MRMKRQNYRRTGSCTGAVCVGWNAMNVMWAVCSEMDQEHGTDYLQRLKNWILAAQSKGLTVAGALTDAKGDRSLKPSQQLDPDTNLRITEVREDGIVIRGAKLMICGTAPQYGHLIQKCLKAGAGTAESRFKAARLSEWLTIGSGVPGCMHGGGSPDGAKLVVRFTTPFEEYADYAKNIINIEEEITEPQKRLKN